MPLYMKMSQNINETCKISLYFDSYKSSMD